jgi:hypothetical protein
MTYKETIDGFSGNQDPDAGGKNWVRASATSYNAAVMGGIRSPGTSNSSKKANKGAQNMVRFYENWNGIDFTYKGSYVCLWAAEEVAGMAIQFRAPDRQITYDTDFLLTEPPGMPSGTPFAEVIAWRELSPDVLPDNQ